jgi:NAD(P)-dependent dehydrogenase (short-subunit alcohol dehydrogenase family)
MRDTNTPTPSAGPLGAPKAALITGAAMRLGRDIALAMAADGWDIAIHYRQSRDAALALEAEIRAMGRQAVMVCADLGNAHQVEAAFQNAVMALPHLNCVVNNASQFEFDRPESTDARRLSEHYQSNVIAPVMLTQFLHGHLAPRHVTGHDPIGVVIHLLDQKLANPNPDFYAYTLSKAALLEATRLSAMAMAPVIRVVGIGPGITLPSADQTPEEFAKTHTMTPLGASSRPQDIAQSVVWLAQARAVTGTMLLVDGGQHLSAHPRDVMMMIR